MRFNFFSTLVSLSVVVASVAALTCDETNRFGNATVTPPNPKEGDVSSESVLSRFSHWLLISFRLDVEHSDRLQMCNRRRGKYATLCRLLSRSRNRQQWIGFRAAHHPWSSHLAAWSNVWQHFSDSRCFLSLLLLYMNLFLSKIPHALFSGGIYLLRITNTHSRNDTDGQPFLRAGTFGPIIAPIVGTFL